MCCLWCTDTAAVPFQHIDTSSPAPRFVSLSNMVVFSLCRKAAAPMAFHSLLIGADTTKGFRVSDGLLDSLWNDLLVAMVFRSWGVTIHLSWYSFGVFCGHLVVGLLYLLVSQIVRILTMRRYEIKIMLESLVGQRTDDLRMFGEAEGDEEEQQQKSNKKSYSYITIADEDELYKRDGYVSSPGSIFPRLI